MLYAISRVMIDGLLYPAQWKLPFIRLQYWMSVEPERKCFTFLHLTSLSVNRVISEVLAESPATRPKLCEKVLPLPSEAEMTKALLRQFAYRTMQLFKDSVYISISLYCLLYMHVWIAI